MRAHLIRVAALALALSSPVAAQQAAAPSVEDLKALIYYAASGDAAAAAAETRRLQALFPGWTPPAEPAALDPNPAGAEIDALYALVAADDPTGARAALDALRARHGGWTPPEDLIRLIATAEAQAALSSAFGARDLPRAVAIMREAPELRRCDRVNNVWRLAELQAAAGDVASALAAHGGVLAACEDFAIIVATLEKTSPLADRARLTEMLDRARRRFPGRAAELDALALRLTGAAPAPVVARAAPQAAATAATPRPAPAEGEAPKATRRVARREATPPPTGLRGAAAMAQLPARGDPRLPAVLALIERRAWAECLEVSDAPRSVEVLYQRSWCAYNLDRPFEALAGFRVAAAGGLDATATRDAAFGMALAYLARDMSDDAALVAANSDLTPAQRRQVEATILNQRGVRAFKAGEHRRAIAFFDALEALDGGLPMDLAMLRGYAYLELGERQEAQSQFSGLHRRIATPATRAGGLAAGPTGD